MTGLGIHAVCYVAVNLLLVAIWIMGGGNANDISTYLTNLSLARQADFWPIYVMLFWGVGLAIHAGVVVVTLPSRLRQRRRQRRSRDNIHRTVLGILDGTMLEGAALATIRATDGDVAAKRVKRQVRRAREADARDARHRQHHTATPTPATDRAPDADVAASSKPKRRQRQERQWLAVMFTDIVDSTRLNRQLGDELWARVLAEHRRDVRRSVAEHGGTEVGTQGDGFLLRFESPDAAVSCATALQRQWSTARVASVSDGQTPVPGVRIGMHAGEVVHDEDDLVGQVINLASRVTDVADPDEILVTEPLADHLTDGVKLVDRGLKTLKGFDRPRHLLAVVWQDAPDIVSLDGDHGDQRAGEPTAPRPE